MNVNCDVGGVALIYVTGDTHGLHDIGKLRQLSGVDKSDYLIICGDVACCWDGNSHDAKVVEKLLELVPCTILWIDGNHENFNIINSLKVTEWHGGKVHQLHEQLIHLMRGEIYTIEDKTFFCFGGGFSIDKAMRTENVSWWAGEMPSREEYENGINSLSKVNNEVDYVITHTAPHFICEQLVDEICPGEEDLQHYLTSISKSLKFNKWYYGHWHFDTTIDNYIGLYYNIQVIGE